MNRHIRDDAGAVAVTVAIMVIVFVAISALVVDLGYWYTVRRQLQAGADAAALAGCQYLAQEKSDTEIWAIVEEFAAHNDVIPVEGVTVVEPSPGGQSDIGDDYVKVTVRTESPSFFARVFDWESATIAAQSVAEVGYLAGARQPVPWALPILEVTKLVATVDGYGDVELSEQSDGTWTGLLPFGASSRSVDLAAYNDQMLDPAYPEGVPEVMSDVANLVRIPVTSRIADVRMQANTVTSGYGESIRVYVDTKAPLESGESIVAHIGKRDVTFTQLDPTTFTGSITVPDTDDLWASSGFAIAIVKSKKDVESIPTPFLVSVRRSTHPILDVRVSPVAAPDGVSTSARIDVTLNRYTYGLRYELKVIGGGGETGNFMSVDFSTIRHEPYWRHPQDPAEYPGLPGSTSTYYEYVAGTAPYDFILHIGDTVWTQTGNMSGPQTRSALDTRFGSEPADFDGWVAAGKPGSRRLIYVPITQKVQTTTGQSPLRVVSFATFYVEEVVNDSGGALVRGRFVEYTAPSWYVTPTPPSSGLVIKTAHLTANHLDF